MIRTIILTGVALGMAAPVAVLIATDAGAATINDYVVDDGLGQCVEDRDLELAYAASGKKDGMVPRTCLPKPCAYMLEPVELAELIGDWPTPKQWDDYISAYSDLCVAETGGAWGGDEASAAARPTTVQSFWGPIIAPAAPIYRAAYAPRYPGSGSAPLPRYPGSGSAPLPVWVGPSRPGSPPPVVVPPVYYPPTFTPPDVPGVPPVVVPPEPAPVIPVPASLPLMLSGIGALAWWRVRK